MPTSQLETIEKLRLQNYSYRFIGDLLSMSENTVKSICRRKHYNAEGPRKTKAEKLNAQLCKYCHTPLNEGRTNRSFCSEQCRLSWWSENRKVIEK